MAEVPPSMIIAVTESAITKDVTCVQPPKARSVMFTTESGIVTTDRFKHGTHCTLPRGLLLVVNRRPKPKQLGKAWMPMFTTELGITIYVKLLHPEKARSPMAVTEFSKTTDGPSRGLRSNAPLLRLATESGISTVIIWKQL